MKLPRLFAHTTNGIRTVIVPADYIVLVRESEILLLKTTAQKTEILSRHVRGEDFLIAFESCIKGFVNSPRYWGQPLEIVLNDNHSFIYAKRLSDNGKINTLRHVSLLTTPEMIYQQVVSNTKKQTTFVLQGMNKVQVQQITDITTRYKLSVYGIITLAGYAIPCLSQQQQDRSKTIMLNREAIADLTDFKGNLIFSNKPTGTVSNSTLLSTELHVSLFPFNHIPFAKLRWQSTVRPLRHQIASSKNARTLGVALGSARLLNAMLAVLCVTLLVIAGITSLTTSTSSVAAASQADYEALHQEQRLQDSLVDLQSRQQQQSDLSPSQAAMLSLFFQTKTNGMYLRTVTTRKQGKDSTLIETEGVASGEKAIFAYQQELNKLVLPKQFRLLSVKPETVVNGTNVDTLTAFKLQLVLTNAFQPTKL